MAKRAAKKKSVSPVRKPKAVKKGEIRIVKKGINFLDIKCSEGFHPQTVIDKGVVTVHCVPNA